MLTSKLYIIMDLLKILKFTLRLGFSEMRGSVMIVGLLSKSKCLTGDTIV